MTPYRIPSACEISPIRTPSLTPDDESDMTYIEQLIDLTKRWNNHEDIPRSQQLECRRIGRAINAAGGFSAMQAAYWDAHNANQYVHIIQAYWDGIGDWRW